MKQNSRADLIKSNATEVKMIAGLIEQYATVRNAEIMPALIMECNLRLMFIWLAHRGDLTPPKKTRQKKQRTPSDKLQK